MFLLDTNVISEMRPKQSRQHHARVGDWMRSVRPDSIFLSSITIFELELGALLAERRDLPKGAALHTWIDNYVLPAFEGRILSVDTAVAQRCAALHIERTRPERDALIAATALVHNLTVVTRNTADFAPTGVATLNPWEA